MDLEQFLYSLLPNGRYMFMTNQLEETGRQIARQKEEEAARAEAIKARLAQEAVARSEDAAADAQAGVLWDKRKAERKAGEAASAKGKGVSIQGGGGGESADPALSALYGAKASIASSQLGADPRLALLQALNLTAKKYGGLGETLSRNEESRTRLGALWGEDRKKTDLALRTGEAELARGQTADLQARRDARSAEIARQQAEIDARQAKEAAMAPKPATKKTELERLREEVEKRRLEKELSSLNADQDPYGLISGTAEGYLKILKRVLSRSM